MRFMMLMLPGDYREQPDELPKDRIATMMTYNESLQQAGVLLALDGLHPPSSGARVSFASGKATVVDGPFAEAREVIGGYWLIDVKSRAEAIEWARRCPGSDSEVIEVRQVQEVEELASEVQELVENVELGRQ